MEEVSLLDLLPDAEAEKFKSQKSTDWKWTFADYPKDRNGLKVFSCFACGGGSTMGYKLAGCTVLGCCEIDPRMNEVYVANHHPKYNYLMDIRDFNKIPLEEIPEELKNLDILDGSPPCTTFSMAGKRKETWGKAKKFREGQKEQTLDDLSFVFLETVARIKPKCVIMENVEGMLLGDAFNYVRKIYSQFKENGYKAHHWLLKGETMGVPQTRHRVFFVAFREDLGKDPKDLNMVFDYTPITYGEIKTGVGSKCAENTKRYMLCKQALPHEKKLGDVNRRLYGKPSAYQSYMIDDDSIIPTLRSINDIIDRNEIAIISRETIRRAQTFPEDFDFGNRRSNVEYICGMSVPPVMIKRIVTRVIESGVFG